MPSDILEILKQNAQLHPVLPDKVAKIKGTIFDESYPQRSDSTHRGVANRGVRRQTVAVDNNDMNENVPVNEVEEVDNEESPAENEEEVNSYDLRSRQNSPEPRNPYQIRTILPALHATWSIRSKYHSVRILKTKSKIQK